jgi:hypothetical protein
LQNYRVRVFDKLLLIPFRRREPSALQIGGRILTLLNAARFGNPLHGVTQ